MSRWQSIGHVNVDEMPSVHISEPEYGDVYYDPKQQVTYVYYGSGEWLAIPDDQITDDMVLPDMLC